MSDTNLNLLNIKEQALQLTAQGDSVVSKIEQELYEMLVVKKDSIAFWVGRNILNEAIARQSIDLTRYPQLERLVNDTRSSLVTVMWVDNSSYDLIRQIYQDNNLWLESINKDNGRERIIQKKWIWPKLWAYLLSLWLHYDNVDEVIRNSFEDIKALLKEAGANTWALTSYHNSLVGSNNGWGNSWSGNNWNNWSWWGNWGGIDGDWDVEGFSENLTVSLKPKSYSSSKIKLEGTLDGYTGLSNSEKKGLQANWSIIKQSNKNKDFLKWQLNLENDWTFSLTIDAYKASLESDFDISFDVASKDAKKEQESWTFTIDFSPNPSLLDVQCKELVTQDGEIELQVGSDYKWTYEYYYKNSKWNLSSISWIKNWNKVNLKLPTEWKFDVYVIAWKLMWSEEVTTKIHSVVSGVEWRTQSDFIEIANSTSIKSDTEVFTWSSRMVNNKYEDLVLEVHEWSRAGNSGKAFPISVDKTTWSWTKSISWFEEMAKKYSNPKDKKATIRVWPRRYHGNSWKQYKNEWHEVTLDLDIVEEDYVNIDMASGAEVWLNKEVKITWVAWKEWEIKVFESNGTTEVDMWINNPIAYDKKDWTHKIAIKLHESWSYILKATCGDEDKSVPFEYVWMQNEVTLSDFDSEVSITPWERTKTSNLITIHWLRSWDKLNLSWIEDKLEFSVFPPGTAMSHSAQEIKKWSKIAYRAYWWTKEEKLRFMIWEKSVFEISTKIDKEIKTVNDFSIPDQVGRAAVLRDSAYTIIRWRFLGSNSSNASVYKQCKRSNTNMMKNADESEVGCEYRARHRNAEWNQNSFSLDEMHEKQFI